MTIRSVPRDQEILDEFFSLAAKPGLEKIAWLYGMVAVYGKHPEELKHFVWNEDNSISLKHKKRPLRPLHPQWVFLFQLKEKQPSRTKSCWNALSEALSQAQDTGLVSRIDDVLLAHKVRKIYYTPARRPQRTTGCQKKQRLLLCSA